MPQTVICPDQISISGLIRDYRPTPAQFVSRPSSGAPRLHPAASRRTPEQTTLIYDPDVLNFPQPEDLLEGVLVD